MKQKSTKAAWAALSCKIIFYSIASAQQPYQTLGPGSCGLGQAKCHAEENDWYTFDEHAVTADVFFTSSPSPDMIKILSNYGLTLEQARWGDSPCMKCHALVISGKEREEATNGVGCESCHGPGSGYKDPHALEREPFIPPNQQQKAYIQGLKFGMVDNENLDVRAQMCGDCHFIGEQKLVSAGHPTGEKFDYAKGMIKIARHWQRPVEPAEILRPVFAAMVDAKFKNVVRNVAPKKPAALASAQPAAREKPEPPPKPQPDSAITAVALSTIAPAAVLENAPKKNESIIQESPLTESVTAPALPTPPINQKLPPMQRKAPQSSFILPDSLSDLEKLERIKLQLDALLQKHFGERR